MELRHIRYFVAIAEERNFTRAAARLGIAQPPLSQQIKDLETELGSSLFRRVPQGAELTIAGQAFLEEARAVLAASDRAVKAAERAARGEQGRLRLGFTASAPYNSLVTRAIRDFMHTCPAVLRRAMRSEHHDVARAHARRHRGRGFPTPWFERPLPSPNDARRR